MTKPNVAVEQLSDREAFIRSNVASSEKLLGDSLTLFRQISEAVAEIKASGEWKARAANWVEYCPKYLGKSRMYFDRIEKFVQHSDELLALKNAGSESDSQENTMHKSVHPKNREQSRALSRLPLAEQAKVIDQVKGKVTGKAIEQAIEAEHEDVIRDAFNAEVPKHLHVTWLRAVEVGKTLTGYTKATRMLLSHGIGEDVIFAELSNNEVTKADALHKECKRVTPYCLCTTCKGIKHEKCDHCKGRGFFSRFQFDRLPKS